MLARRYDKLVALRGFVLLAFVYSFFGFFASYSRWVFLVSTAVLGIAWGGITSLKPAILSGKIRTRQESHPPSQWIVLYFPSPPA